MRKSISELARLDIEKAKRRKPFNPKPLKPNNKYYRKKTREIRRELI